MHLLVQRSPNRRRSGFISPSKHGDFAVRADIFPPEVCSVASSSAEHELYSCCIEAHACFQKPREPPAQIEQYFGLLC